MLKVSGLGVEFPEGAEHQLCRTAVRVRHSQHICCQLWTLRMNSYFHFLMLNEHKYSYHPSYLAFGLLQKRENISLWEAEHRRIINTTDANVKPMQTFALQKSRKLLLTGEG